jgi:AcrR family transcriptional regulator
MNHRVSPKPAVRRTHAERSAATRHHLIHTAIEVIQRRSLEEMSINELAKSAGMTAGAVQHHFESKAVLMMNVLSELIESTAQSGELWPDSALPPRERATLFVQAMWRLVYAQPRFVVAWNIYLGCRNQPEVLDHIAELRREVQDRVQEDFFTTFPELAAEADRDGFLGMVLSALRGLGLLQLFATGPIGDAPHAAQKAQLDCLAGLIAARCEAAVSPPAKPRTRRR